MNNEQPPKPSIETIQVLRDLANYAVARHQMPEQSRDVLECAISDQANYAKLVLAVVGSHKMRGLDSLLSAIDLCKEKMTDPDYIAALVSDPDELRRHLEVLKRMEESDLEFVRMMTGESPEKKGFSADPRNQYNQFFGPQEGTHLPDELRTENRRKVASVLNGILALVEDRVPKEPTRQSRVVIDMSEEHDDRSDSTRSGSPDKGDS